MDGIIDAPNPAHGQEGRALSPIAEARRDWPSVATEVAKALPQHIPLERFERVVFTAIQGNPDLLEADRRSLWGSCVKAAQDGLLPDGRDGAIVTYFDRKAGRLLAQWMPMVAGIQKSIRNSGEVLSLSANVVYEGERFEVLLGDDEKILHVRDISATKKPPVAVYAIASLRNGEKVREVMSWPEIEDVRRASKSPDRGPWGTWPGEMARKTVIRRLAKRLPRSSDREEALHGVINRVDEQYDFDRDRGRQDDRKAPATIDGEAERAPAVWFVAVDGQRHPCADVAQWRADWLKRIKALVAAGRLGDLREAHARNREAIIAVADLAPLTADEVDTAIRAALGTNAPAPAVSDFPGDLPSASEYRIFNGLGEVVGRHSEVAAWGKAMRAWLAKYPASWGRNADEIDRVEAAVMGDAAVSDGERSRMEKAFEGLRAMAPKAADVAGDPVR